MISQLAEWNYLDTQTAAERFDEYDYYERLILKLRTVKLEEYRFKRKSKK